MSKKKIVAFAIALLGLFFVIAPSNKVGLNNTVKAAQKPKYDKLVPYTVPKRFRGTWHEDRGKNQIKFTKNRIIAGRVNRPTYKFTTFVSPKSRVWLVLPYGKMISISLPGTDATGYYRQGKYLISEAIGQKWRYHRIK